MELGRPLPLKSSRKVVSQAGAAADTDPDAIAPSPNAVTAILRTMANGLVREDMDVPSTVGRVR